MGARHGVRSWWVRGRAALLESVIGAPQTLPHPRAVDLSEAWARYEASAPAHVRAGFGAAALLLGEAAPRLMGYGAGLARLDDAARDAVMQRAASLPLGADLVLVAKVVACLVYFGSPAVEDAARAPQERP